MTPMTKSGIFKAESPARTSFLVSRLDLNLGLVLRAVKLASGGGSCPTMAQQITTPKRLEDHDNSGVVLSSIDIKASTFAVAIETKRCS